MKHLSLLAACSFFALSATANAQTATLSIPPALSCVEGGTVKIPVTRSGSLSVTAPFSFKTMDDTAVAGRDFVGLSGNQSVRRGARTYTLTLSCTPDNGTYTADKKLIFTITSRSAAIGIGNGQLIVTVKENDPAPPPPQAAITVRTIGAIEGQSYRVYVERSGGDLSKEVRFGYSTLPDTATSPADFPARSGTLKFNPGQSQVVWDMPTTDDSEHEQEEQGLITVRSSDAPVAIAQAEFTITDNDAPPPPDPIPNPGPQPDPPPPIDPVPDPEPQPVPGTGNVYVASPTPTGMVPQVDSPGDLISITSPTPSAAPDVVGAFRFICTTGAIAKIDSLLYWGKPGASHWHQFYGQADVSAFDTYETIETKKSRSTCQKPTLDPGNDSQYWTPAWIMTLPAGTPVPEYAKPYLPDPSVMDAEGKLTKPTDFHLIANHFQNYYKRRPASSPGCSIVRQSVWAGVTVTGCSPVPFGLNFIFGFDMKNMQPGVKQAEYQCIGGGNDAAKFKGIKEALAICADAWDRGVRTNLRIATRLEGYDCWDPRYLDSPNHQAHMSYSVHKLGTGKSDCQMPATGATEVRVIPQLTLLQSYGYNEWVHAAYRADPEWGVRLSSDDHWRAVQPEVAFAGGSGHADARFRWVPSVLAKWTDNCINRLLSCSAGNLGNGQMLAGGGAPFYKSLGRTSWEHPMPVMPVRPDGYSPDTW